MNPLRLLIISLLSLIVFTFSGTALYLHQKGDKLLSVQTNSMMPAFKKGDAVLSRKVDYKELNVGDIISYQNPKDNREIVTHRLSKINYQTGRLVTQGDNNSSSDIPFPAALLVGKVYLIVPGTGRFLDWVRKPEGLAVVLYVPASLVLVLEARRLSLRVKHKKYQEHRYLISKNYGVV